MLRSLLTFLFSNLIYELSELIILIRQTQPFCIKEVCCLLLLWLLPHLPGSSPHTVVLVLDVVEQIRLTFPSFGGSGFRPSLQITDV